MSRKRGSSFIQTNGELWASRALWPRVYHDSGPWPHGQHRPCNIHLRAHRPDIAQRRSEPTPEPRQTAQPPKDAPVRKPVIARRGFARLWLPAVARLLFHRTHTKVWVRVYVRDVEEPPLKLAARFCVCTEPAGPSDDLHATRIREGGR